jgi:hypothetical protein
MALRRRGPGSTPPRPPAEPAAGGARPPAGGLEEVTGRDFPPPAPTHPTPPAPASPPSTASPIEVIGRFDTASAALAFVSELIAMGRSADARLLRDETGGAGACWVATRMPITVGRELITACSGRPYLRQGRSFVPERGWGPAVPLSTGAREQQDAASLVDVTVLDLIRVAGLHPVQEPPIDRVVVLTTGPAVAPLVRRALELGLSVTHQPVELHPLFSQAEFPRAAQAADHVPVGSGSTCLALELRPRPSAADGDGPGPELPAALVSALGRDPLLLVCRVTGDSLLVQHGLGSALPDRPLAALVPEGERWLLADAVFGCAVVRALAEPRDSAHLVRLGPGYDIVPVADAGPHGPLEAPNLPLQVVADRTTGVEVDAALLDTTDLEALAILLEGHPLAEAAHLVRGDTWHLLVAAGGLLEWLPVGEPLYCLGPGPLYLPVGRRLSPPLPPTARTRLFGAGQGTAVVLRPDGGLSFDLTEGRRQPVWTLWAGPPPVIRPQFDADELCELRAVEASLDPPPAAPPPRRRRFRRPVPEPTHRTWRDDAFDAELSGDLAGAARLFERNDEPERAAHLYERAARLGTGPRS